MASHTSSSNMKNVIITPERFHDVIVHLRRTFFADEPLNQCVQITGGTADAGHAELEKHCAYTMAEGLSLMALSDDNEIAGVCLNGIVRPGELERGLAKLAENPDQRFSKIFRLLYEENIKLDLFRRYGTEQIFELRILSVDGRFRGRGIAKQLLKQSQQLAVAEGFRVLKGEATGLFSQKILQAEEFAVIGEACYAARRNADGTAMFPVQEPHESLKIMIKVLEKSTGGD